jgi:hypothetical protein
MSEDLKQTPEEEPKRSVEDELAKYRSIAERKEKQAKAAAEQVAAMMERLSEYEAKERERAEAQKAAEQEKLAHAGEFEKLKQEWEAERRAIAADLDKYKSEVEVYRKRDEDVLTQLLEGRDDAEQILGDLDGLPLARKLAAVQRIVGVDATTAPSINGKPEARTANTSSVDSVQNDPEFEEACKIFGISTSEDREAFAKSYKKE